MCGYVFHGACLSSSAHLQYKASVCNSLTIRRLVLCASYSSLPQLILWRPTCPSLDLWYILNWPTLLALETVNAWPALEFFIGSKSLISLLSLLLKFLRKLIVQWYMLLHSYCENIYFKLLLVLLFLSDLWQNNNPKCKLLSFHWFSLNIAWT